MDVDEALRRAADDLRSAATAVPPPRFLPGDLPGRGRIADPPSTRLVVAGAAGFAALVVAVWVALGGGTDLKSSPPATPSPTPSATVPSSLCGPAFLPDQVHPPAGWREAQGAADGAPPAAHPAQLVVRFTGPDGAQVEARWPADPARELRPWPDDLATGDLLVERPDAGPAARGLLTLPVGAGACRFVALAWFGGVPEEFGTGWGAFAEADDPPGYRRAVQGLVQFVRGDPGLVTTTETVSRAPTVQPCPDIGAGQAPAGEARDRLPVGTPEAALQRFLELEVATTVTPAVPPAGYRKVVDRSGHVWFATFDDLGQVLVYTDRTAAGWVVVSWERSAC